MSKPRAPGEKRAMQFGLVSEEGPGPLASLQSLELVCRRLAGLAILSDLKGDLLSLVQASKVLHAQQR